MTRVSGSRSPEITDHQHTQVDGTHHAVDAWTSPEITDHQHTQVDGTHHAVDAWTNQKTGNKLFFKNSQSVKLPRSLRAVLH